MTQAYVGFLLRHRWLAIILSLLVVVAAGWGGSYLTLSADSEVFFAEDDPQLAAYDSIRNTYTSDDNVYMVYVPADGDVFTPDNLAVVERITEAAWKMPYAIRVDSLSNFQHTEADGDDLAVAPLVENAADMSAEQVERVRKIATNEPLLKGRIVTESGHMTAINVTMGYGSDARDQALTQIIPYTRELRAQIEADYPGSALLVTGKVPGDNAFTEAALGDLTGIMPIALLLALACIAAFMWMSSRSVLTAAMTTLATIIIVIASVVTAMGAAGWLGYVITSPLANAPTVILTLAVADAMHIMVIYFQRLRGGADKLEAMHASLVLNFQAVALTSVTTIIGFLALNFSDAPPFHDLGNVSAMGIAAAWLFSITLLPALVTLLPGSAVVTEGGDTQGRAMQALADWVIRNHRRCLVVSGTLIIAAAACVPMNELYDVWAEYFDESTQIRKDSDRARAHLNGFNTLEFAAGAGGPGDVADPDYLRTLDNFANWLREQPQVAHVSTFSDIMKRLNKNMHGDEPAWYKLPDNRELAAQYLLLYEFSLPFGLDLTNQVNLQKSGTRVIAALRTSSTRDLLALQDRAQAWQRDNADDDFFHVGASSDAMFAHIGHTNVRSMLLGSLLGIAVIAVIIGLALRSLTFGLLSLAANILPMLVGFGLWGLLHGRVGLGLSVVSGLTMGIVVDYTVHLFSKYLRAKREQNLSTPDAIRYAFGTVGVALIVTTLVLCANFGMLAFSVFALNSDMGTLTAGIILIALVIDLFFLPPVLMALPDRVAEPVGEALQAS